MRAGNFKKINDKFIVVHKGDDPVACWTYTTAGGLVALAEPDKRYMGNDFYTIEVETGPDDCWWLIKWGVVTEMAMIGDAEVLSWLYTGITGETKNYKQYALDDGEKLQDIAMTEVGEGFYYAEPRIEPSLVVMSDWIYRTLTIPYIAINCTEAPKSVLDGAQKNFINVGYATMGFQGNRHSYFDMGTGKWVDDDSVEAKASDLAKAVCYKYGLNWSDTSAADWVGNYLKYLLSYEENQGRSRYYKVAKTPDGNAANFQLVQTDEDGNEYIRGVSMLLLQSLETVGGTDGAIITFKEEV